jgi:hypothetical protein
VQHPALEVVDLEGGEFAPAGARVGRQPHQQFGLLGLEQAERGSLTSGLGRQLRRRSKQPIHIGEGQR